MTNIMDKGDKHLRFRTRNGEEEIYYILCLEEKDYAEFIDDCLIMYMPDAGENNILKFFNELGLDIRRKNEDESLKEEIKTPEKIKEVQSVIA